MKRPVIAVLVGGAIVGLGLSVAAQSTTYKARLSPVPVESNNVAAITGTGSVTAVLTGASLAINGTFEGMKSPATLAQIHLGQRGVRGPVMFDLTVTKAVSGTITATIALTPVQVEALKQSRFYVQIHSEKAPDGNLWGWLLP